MYIEIMKCVKFQTLQNVWWNTDIFFSKILIHAMVKGIIRIEDTLLMKRNIEFKRIIFLKFYVNMTVTRSQFSKF